LFIAVFGVLLAFGARIALKPLLGNASPFLLFTPPVAVAALYGGAFAGAVATALGAVLGSHFLLRALGEPALVNWDRTVLFLIVGGVITSSSAYVYRARAALSRSLWREQKARAMAEAADRAKDDFIALISHELRGPASVISGWISMLRNGGQSASSVTHALDAIERNGQVMTRLVDDLLEQSRIATGTLRLDPQPISMATVLRAALDQTRAKMEAKQLSLQLSLPREDLQVCADSIRLQQVFTNLLSNSVKFTPQGGMIRLALSARPMLVEVTVTDTGAGIDADFLPHVFDRFRQSARTRADSKGGLGLGLSLSRQIVEHHHGTISARSDGPNRGATFSVTLPRLEGSTDRNADATAVLVH
jgi:signal transduction histidine kinase